MKSRNVLRFVIIVIGLLVSIAHGGSEPTLVKPVPPEVEALNRQAAELFRQRKYDQAISVARRYADAVRELRGENDAQYAPCLNNLAQLYHQLGDSAAAEPLYKQALEINRKVLGNDHVHTALSCNNLGSLYDDKGDYSAAEPLYQTALEINRKAFGEEHPTTASSMNNLARLYRHKGDNAAAEPLYRAALAIRRKTLGEFHPDTAASMNNLAMLYEDKCDFIAAEAMFKSALAIKRKSLGEEHPSTATTINNLAGLYKVKGEYALAKPLFEQALAIQRKVFGENHPGTATGLDNLAALYQDMGDYESAEPLFRQALAIYKKVLGENHPETAISLNNLAGMYLDKCDFAAAEPLLIQALAISRRTMGENHASTAQSMANLGSLYLAKGDYARAEALFKDALAINRKAWGDDNIRTARSLQALAHLYHENGEEAQVESLLKQALATTRRVFGKYHRETASNLVALATVYQANGDNTAEPLFQEALEIQRKVLGENHPVTASTMNSLAELYRSMGDYALAEPLYTQALAINRKVWGDAHPATGTTLNDLGLLYVDMGADAAAERLFKEAIAIKQRALGASHPDTARSIANLAFVYLDRGDYAAAEPLLRDALAIRRKALGDHHADTARNVENLGALWAAKGDLSAAEPLLREGWLAEAAYRDRLLAVGSTNQQAAYISYKFSGRDPFLSFADSVMHDPNAPASLRRDAGELAARVLLGEKGAALEAGAAHSALATAGNDSAVRPLYAAWISAAAELARWSMISPTPKQLPIYRARLEALQNSAENAERALAEKSRPFSVERLASQVTPKQIVATLGPGASLVEYARYRPFNFKGKRQDRRLGQGRYIAIIIRSQDRDHADNPDVTWVALGDAAPIDAAAGKWRAAATAFAREGGQPSLLSVESAGAELKKLIWTPVARELGPTQHVYISPDVALNFIPFAALPGKAPGAFLLDEGWDMAYVATGRDLVRSAEGIGGPPMLLGDPDFGAALPDTADSTARPAPDTLLAVRRSTGLGLFTPLPGTRVEVDGVAKLLHVPPLLGKAATEAAVKSAKHPTILHLATHAFFLPALTEDKLADDLAHTRGIGAVHLAGDRPLNEDQPRAMAMLKRLQEQGPMRRSGIALAGANDTLAGRRPPGGDDGILTAEEVASMDLWGTKLVTLSACETGLGDLSGSEGVYGLRRAFTLAGAQNVIMSLWSVDDASTAQLMKGIYAGIAEGKSPQRALLAAQKQYLADARKADRSTHPFYWAAFVASGNGNGLATSSAK